MSVGLLVLTTAGKGDLIVSTEFEPLRGAESMGVTQALSFQDLPGALLRACLRDDLKLARLGPLSSPLCRLGDRFVINPPLVRPIMFRSGIRMATGRVPSERMR
jgi:hypothetical protein